MGPRKHQKSKGLPENLYVYRKNEVYYYRYRHPKTRRDYGLGTDRQAAIQAARKLNSELMDYGRAGDLVARVTGAHDFFGTFIDRFVDEILPGLRKRHGGPLSAKTISEYRRELSHVKAALGSRPFGEINRRRVAEFLHTFPATASNRYRAVISLVSRYAIADGLMEENPIAKTIARTENVQRHRLNLKGYLVACSKAEPWEQNAFAFALHTIQRREDLVRLQFSDYINGTLKVHQQKTGTFVEIEAAAELHGIIQRCRDEIPSPFLIHRKPDRHVKSKHRGHWTQVLPDMLSRAFQRARDASGQYDHLPQEQRPSFHEIRSLGADLYRKRGWPESLIQQLLGHKNIEMTNDYLKGHAHVFRVGNVGIDLSQFESGSRSGPG